MILAESAKRQTLFHPTSRSHPVPGKIDFARPVNGGIPLKVQVNAIVWKDRGAYSFFSKLLESPRN